MPSSPADRAQRAEAALLASFTARAARLAAEIGPVPVDDDNDERLELRSDGVFAGTASDHDGGDWHPKN